MISECKIPDDLVWLPNGIIIHDPDAIEAVMDLDWYESANLLGCIVVSYKELATITDFAEDASYHPVDSMLGFVLIDSCHKRYSLPDGFHHTEGGGWVDNLNNIPTIVL